MDDRKLAEDKVELIVDRNAAAGFSFYRLWPLGDCLLAQPTKCESYLPRSRRNLERNGRPLASTLADFRTLPSSTCFERMG
jgi:hypothetical protein